MKRMISFMMALALILSLGVTAFADGGAGVGTISISNATVGETYKVYKIFNAIYNADGDVAYTLENSTLENLMFGAGAKEYNIADAGQTENKVKAATFFDFDATTKAVTLKSGASAANLFKYLSKLVDETDFTATDTKVAGSATVDFTGLDTGYYVIKRNNDQANAVTITTAKPTANVIDKNQLPGQLDKTPNNSSANVGDTINWEVTFTATNYDGETKITEYTLKDNLNPSNWATIDTGSIRVYVNNVEISDWSIVSPSEANGFEIKIPWANKTDGVFTSFKYPATSDVKVTYSATVQAAAATANPNAADINENTVELEWTNKSEGPEDTTETEVYNLGFTKVDGTDGSGLIGAEFELYRVEKQMVDGVEKDVEVRVNVTKNANGLYIVNPTGTDTIVTPDGGKVVIQGLAEGKYLLKETKAPAGYNQLTAPVEVTVGTTGVNMEMPDGSDEDSAADVYVVNNNELNIENNSGVELPSTGGQGTMLMITIGTMMAIAFAVLLITQKKMSVYHD